MPLDGPKKKSKKNTGIYYFHAKSLSFAAGNHKKFIYIYLYLL